MTGSVLVTGSLGLIGSEVCREAQNAGWDVVGVDDGRGASVDHVHGTLIARSVEQAWARDVTGRHDMVVHCAAPVGPVGILTARVLDDMHSATRAAVGLAARWDAALVVMSSSEVYGTQTPTGMLTVPDEWSHRVEYSVGKVATELAARRHHAETGLPTMVVRPWNIVGPHQSAGKGFVIPRMAEQAVRGQRPTVYRPGDQRRAFMHVADLAAILVDRMSDTSLPGWDASPVDAAAPHNAVSMIELAHMFGPRVEVVDPVHEHGPEFREAHAGSKLPPSRPAMKGWTPLSAIVAEAIGAARERLGAAA